MANFHELFISTDRIHASETVAEGKRVDRGRCQGPSPKWPSRDVGCRANERLDSILFNCNEIYRNFLDYSVRKVKTVRILENDQRSIIREDIE